MAQTLRVVALDLSALIAKKSLDFDIETVPSPVSSHEWLLGERVRNLLHNAIQHTPWAARWHCACTMRTARW